MASPRSVTRECADFAAGLNFTNLPNDVVKLSERCVLDGLGVALAGTEQPVMRVVDAMLAALDGAPRARPLGTSRRVPEPHAALWNGTAGHAMDWDDTQLAEGKDRVFGLMTHPTTAPLAAALAVADSIDGVDGRTFLTAFCAGFEVECKLGLAIAPNHYMTGFHSSGTIGTFGAAVAAAKLFNLDVDRIRVAIGIAASMAAGIRANFGTMMKPLHVGRAAENGVLAAILARDGLTADVSALDGKWGYLRVAGGSDSSDPDLLLGRLGAPFAVTQPGVSVKPYPCGVLTHPSIDAMMDIVRTHNLKPGDVRQIRLYAGRNILEPIRYESASTELEAKFCMPYLLTAVLVAGKLGKDEFSESFILSPIVQELQSRVEVVHDPDIEALGFDRIRSRLEVDCADGTKISRVADDRYRGGPENPLSDSDLDEKFRACVNGLLNPRDTEAAIAAVRQLGSGLAGATNAILEISAYGARDRTPE